VAGQFHLIGDLAEGGFDPVQGRRRNRCAQSRATPAKNPASLRRPSRCRTTAMVSSSASLQPGAGPGRAAIAMTPELTASSTST
jgi:hypothetical protein